MNDCLVITDWSDGKMKISAIVNMAHVKSIYPHGSQEEQIMVTWVDGKVNYYNLPFSAAYQQILSMNLTYERNNT